MSAACMNNTLQAYIDNSSRLGSCPPSPPAATYECLCNSTLFTSWYISTLCINCNDVSDPVSNPVSNLTALCPSFATTISAAYPDSCSPYGRGDAVASSSTGTSSSLSATTGGSSSTTSLSSTATASLTSAGSTTIILSMTTPSLEPSSSSRLSTLTVSPLLATHASVLPSSNQTAQATYSTPTSSSTNTSYTSTSSPTPPVSFSDSSSSSSGMSTGAKAGIGVGAAAAAVGIGFAFMALLTILRRRNSRMKGPGYGRRPTGHVNRSIGGGRPGDTSTTLAEMYHDDEPQFYRGFAGSDGYGSNGSGSGLGIDGTGPRPREKMGLVPSGRIREVKVGEGDEHQNSGFATPLHAEGIREIRHVDEHASTYTEDEFASPQESNGVWQSAVELQDVGVRSPQQHHDNIRYSTAQESNYSQPDAGLRYSTAEESNFEAAMRPRSRIYSVVESPVLDLGQEGLSQEELERLEDEERRIDEAIRESENRAKMRAERGNMGTAL